VNQKHVQDFWYFTNYLTGGDLQHNAHHVLFATRTWQIDPLWLTLCSYFVNVLGFDTLLIWLNNTHGCSHFLLGNTKNCQFTFSNNVFSFKMVRVQIFSWRTTAKVRSNLKIILLTVKCLKTGAMLVNFSILDVMQLYLFLKISFSIQNIFKFCMKISLLKCISQSTLKQFIKTKFFCNRVPSLQCFSLKVRENWFRIGDRDCLLESGTYFQCINSMLQLTANIFILWGGW